MRPFDTLFVCMYLLIHKQLLFLWEHVGRHLSQIRTSAKTSYIYILPHPSLSSELLYYAQGKVNSRTYQGVFKVKSRVKTWQIRGIWSQQLEHKQVPKRGTESGVRKGKRSLLACHIRCKCSTETTHNSVKVKLGIKDIKLVESLIGLEVTVGQGYECHLTFVKSFHQLIYEHANEKTSLMAFCLLGRYLPTKCWRLQTPHFSWNSTIE